MADGLDFIVRISSPGQFVKDVDGRTIDVTNTPSFAKFFTYDDAARLSDRLRRHGYPQSVVCGLDGIVMTFETLQAYRNGLAAREVAEALPRTRKELDVMPTGEYQRRCKTDPAFKARADQLYQQQ